MHSNVAQKSKVHVNMRLVAAGATWCLVGLQIQRTMCRLIIRRNTSDFMTITSWRECRAIVIALRSHISHFFIFWLFSYNHQPIYVSIKWYNYLNFNRFPSETFIYRSQTLATRSNTCEQIDYWGQFISISRQRQSCNCHQIQSALISNEGELASITGWSFSSSDELA